MILGTYTKQPADVLDYDVDYSEFLAGIDTLANKTVVATPAGINVDQSFIVGGRIKVWLSGGTNGVTYKITVTATTSDGRVKQDEFKVKVKDY